MYVTLNRDNQFGEHGPQTGALGKAFEIRKIDGDYWAYTIFPEHTGVFIVLLEHLLHADTSETETFYSTVGGL